MISMVAGGVNPPDVTLFFYAFCILLFVFFVSKLLEKRSVRNIFIPFTYIGTHTLYIFLYHKLFLDYVLSSLVIENCVLRGIVFLWSDDMWLFISRANNVVIKKNSSKILWLPYIEHD